MKNDVTYDLLIIGGGISACVFASKYLKNNITKKVGLIEIGRGLGGRSSTRISKDLKDGNLIMVLQILIYLTVKIIFY